MYTYPRPQDLAYPDRVLFTRGASRGVRKWGRIGAWGRASQARTRETLGFRPALKRVCHCELAGRGQASGAKTPCSRAPSGACQVPGRTDQVLRRRGGASKGVAVASISRRSGKQATVSTLKVRLSALRLPSKRGDKLKAQLARRRGNESAWLFEILIGRMKRTSAQHLQLSSHGLTGRPSTPDC
jgi:hypothetical protein